MTRGAEWQDWKRTTYCRLATPLLPSRASPKPPARTGSQVSGDSKLPFEGATVKQPRFVQKELPRDTLPRMAIIKKVHITAQPRQLGDPLPEVWATLSDGTEKLLSTYYPDEIAFGDGELPGLTEAEALNLKGAKDRAYLRA